MYCANSPFVQASKPTALIYIKIILITVVIFPQCEGEQQCHITLFEEPFFLSEEEAINYDCNYEVVFAASCCPYKSTLLKLMEIYRLEEILLWSHTTLV
jgi:hypothetical protein